MTTMASGEPTDAKGGEQMLAGTYKAMPDLHLTIPAMVAEGDKLVCRNTWRWTDPSGTRFSPSLSPFSLLNYGWRDLYMNY